MPTIPVKTMGLQKDASTRCVVLVFEDEGDVLLRQGHERPLRQNLAERGLVGFCSAVWIHGRTSRQFRTSCTIFRSAKGGGFFEVPVFPFQKLRSALTQLSKRYSM